MTFVVDSFLLDLVLVSAGGALRRDYVAETARVVCANIAAGNSAGVETRKIIADNAVFARPCLVWADGRTAPLSDFADFVPVFIVNGTTCLRSGDIAELFADNPGAYEVTGPAGERIRCTTTDVLTFTPSSLTSATAPTITAEINFDANDAITYVAFGANSFRSHSLTGAAQARARAKAEFRQLPPPSLC